MSISIAINAMPTEPIIYLLEPDAAQQESLDKAARSLGCRIYTVQSASKTIAEIVRIQPDVIVISGRLDSAEQIALCRQIRADGSCQLCHLLLVSEAAIPVRLIGLVDDFIRNAAPNFEVAARLQNGINQAQLRRQVQALTRELEQMRGEQERAGDYMMETTTYLVEIAAQLQSEVVHSAEREEESVRVAQQDTISQAAAALRHEINNPLFAIVGSAESALKRLRALQPLSEAERAPIVSGIERVLKGADRIQQVVHTISAMLTPTTTDYLSGVSMLNLKKNPEEK